MISDELHRQVLAWLADDPDDRDRAELSALLRTAGGLDADAAAEAVTELADRFAGSA